MKLVLPRHNERGFTMVELLITLGVTVFGLMGVLLLHTSLSTGATLAGQSQEAVAVGAEVMETLRSKRPAALCDEVMNGTASVPCNNATYATVLGRNSMSYEVSVDVSVAASNLWLIRVEVSWIDDASGDSHIIPLELMRTSQEAL
jgi:Tfp pilus assembly protein PilV